MTEQHSTRVYAERVYDWWLFLANLIQFWILCTAFDTLICYSEKNPNLMEFFEKEKKSPQDTHGFGNLFLNWRLTANSRNREKKPSNRWKCNAFKLVSPVVLSHASMFQFTAPARKLTYAPVYYFICSHFLIVINKKSRVNRKIIYDPKAVNNVCFGPKLRIRAPLAKLWVNFPEYVHILEIRRKLFGNDFLR